MYRKDSDVKKIFCAAIEKKTAAERSAYLDEACGDNDKLRGEVEALLKAHYEGRRLLDQPVFGAGVTLGESPLAEGPGTRIGRYKLLELIGEGGFGVVYMAEQEEPIRRRVALKIIKLGMDTKQVIARFEAERQALAMMEHPNIAKVLDAGATETGRPYFVMELVRGIPITEYCDKNNLDTRQRLELFIDVCKAVQHAHQKGIIHRDIKPSNVMITLHDGKPVPKIIDFGIAKATEHRLTEKTFFTEYKQFIGTPEYMSPEQAEFSGLDVDTRSDIYSLGVLLYELLTGTTPFEAKQLRSAAFDEVVRIIREEEPDKPSTRLNTLGEALTDVAKHRQVGLGELCKLLRGDLDWIVMKTLEKDRTRRYETANELAMDIERHLCHEPVVAGPPSKIYRLRKFIKRHRTGVAAGLLVAAALILGLSTAIVGFVQATYQRNLAQEQRRRAEVNFQMARDAVDEMARVAEEQLAGDPGAKPAQTELLQKAQLFYAGFLEENKDDPVTLEEIALAYRRLGEIHKMLSQYEEAEQAYRSAIGVFKRLTTEFADVASYRSSLAWTLVDFGAVLEEGKQFTEEEEVCREALPIAEKLVDEFPDVADYRLCLGLCKSQLGSSLSSVRRYGEAKRLYEEAEETFEELVADFPDVVDVVDYQEGLAEVRRLLLTLLAGSHEIGELEHKSEPFKEMIEELAADSPDRPTFWHKLAMNYYMIGWRQTFWGRNEEAEQNCQRAIAIWEKLMTDFPNMPGNSNWLAHGRVALGNVMRNTGRLEEAEDEYRKARELWEKLVAESAGVVEFRLNLIWGYRLLHDVQSEMGQLEEAEESVRDVVELLEKLTADYPDNLFYLTRLATTQSLLGGVLEKAGQPEKAEQSFRQAEKLFEEPITDLPDTAEDRNNQAKAWQEWGNVLQQFGRLETAEKAFQREQKVLEELISDFPSEGEYRNRFFWNYMNLGEVLREKGRLEKAEEAFRSALAVMEKLASDFPDDPSFREKIGRCLTELGDVLKAMGRLEEAEEAYKKAEEIEEEVEE